MFPNINYFSMIHMTPLLTSYHSPTVWLSRSWLSVATCLVFQFCQTIWEWQIDSLFLLWGRLFQSWRKEKKRKRNWWKNWKTRASDMIMTRRGYDELDFNYYFFSIIFPVQMLTPDEYFNVLKIQNGVECSKDEVKTVCLPLPCSKDGKIKIRDFLYLDIHRFFEISFYTYFII